MLSSGINVERVAFPAKGSDGKYEVYYQLTKGNCVPGWSDTEEALGMWFKSILIADSRGNYQDYSYPYALQSNGGWMHTGRVVGDWRKVEFYQESVN